MSEGLVTEVVAFGECMVEVGLTGPSQAALGYAGDTFNTAVYLRRLGLSVAYGTAIGEGDPFSAGILRLMNAAGLDPALVRTVAGRLPGLYAFDRDEAGERRFFYWRAEAPARDYFAIAEREALHKAVCGARLVYLSGISLAIIGDAGRATLFELLAQAKACGAAIAYDPNHRPQLWGNREQAQAATRTIVPLCRYISTARSDLEGLYGAAADESAAEWAGQGIEVVVRSESHAVVVRSGEAVLRIAPDPPVRALDTTGAGDAFNAGYIAARLAGKDPRVAVAAARRLANVVVQHIGAIIPAAAMPSIGSAS